MVFPELNSSEELYEGVCQVPFGKQPYASKYRHLSIALGYVILYDYQRNG